MKIRLTYFILLVITTPFLYASDSTAAWIQWKNTWAKEKINIQTILRQTDSNQIQSIEVIDMRTDTSMIGLYAAGKSKLPHSITTDSSLLQLMNSKLANNAHGEVLLFVIRHLWVNEEKIYGEKGHKIYVPLNNFLYSFQAGPRLLYASKITFAVDIFVHQNEKYYPLVRIDTVLNHWESVSVAGRDLLEDILVIINKKTSQTIFRKKYMNKNPFTRKDIVDTYNQLYLIPVLTDTPLKAGLYYTWEQFKKNQPEKDSFRIQWNPSGLPSLNILTNNEDNYLRNVFAVCIQHHIYKVTGGQLFDMYPEGKTLYWIGLQDYNEGRDLKSNPYVFPLERIVEGDKGIYKTKTKLIPFLINIETGKEY